LGDSLLVISPLAAQQQDRRGPAVERWDVKLAASGGSTQPSWLEVQKSGNNVLLGRFVAVVGSVLGVLYRAVELETGSAIWTPLNAMGVVAGLLVMYTTGLLAAS
jgi:hypothetical protein